MGRLARLGVVLVAAATGAATALVGASAAPTPGEPPRLGFTTDRDELATAVVVVGFGGIRSEPGGTVPFADAATRHTGEVSTTAGGTAFVSTTGGDDDGEVYVLLDGDDPDPIRVTCDNEARETHPVVAPGGDAVAYASDVSGNWDIWVAPVGPEGCEDAEPARRITTHPGADTWPAWAPRGEFVVWSSDRPDPATPPGEEPAPTRGDLYLAPPGAVEESFVVQLTGGPAADTEPTVVADAPDRSFVHVVFTTTRFRDDGSLATTRVPLGSPDPTLPEVLPLWREPGAPPDVPPPPQPQATEPAASLGAGVLLLTTTQYDPGGDVYAVPVELPPGDPNVRAGAQPMIAVHAEPGRHESHGAFLARFDGPFEGDLSADVAVTVHARTADVDDVVGADGTDRRTVAPAPDASEPGAPGAPLDEAGPAYSPDGTAMVYSAGPTGPPTDAGRELVLAATDGTGARPLAYDREDGDVDTDPAFSPDGERLAFVRYRPVGEEGGYGPGRIWLVTLATGETAELRPSEDPSTDDTDPTWSPDGQRIAFAQARRAVDAEVTVRTESPVYDVGTFQGIEVHTVMRGSVAPVDLRVDVPGFTTETDLTLPDGCVAEAAAFVCSQLVLPAAGAVLWFPVRAATPGAHRVVAQVFSTVGDVVPANDTRAAWVTITDPQMQLALTVDDGTDNLIGTGDVLPSEVRVVVTQPVHDFTLTFAASSGLTIGGLPAEGCSVAAGGSTATCIRSIREIAGTGTGEVVLGFTVTVGGLTSATNTVSVTATSLAGAVTDTETLTAFIEGPGPAGPRINLAAATAARSPRGSGALVGDAPAAALPQVAPASALRDSPHGTALSHIRVVDVTGGNEIALEDPTACRVLVCDEPVPLLGRSPAWSPTGTMLAVERDGAVQLVALLDADGDGPDVPERATALAPVTGVRPDGTLTPTGALLSATTTPAWSLDGTELAVTGRPAGVPDDRGVYVVGLDGTLLRTLAQDRGPETDPAYVPPPPPDPVVGEPVVDLAVDVTLDATDRWLGGPPVVAVVTVENRGPGPVPAGVTLLVTLPERLTVVGTDPACPTPTSGCTLGALAADDDVTVRTTLAVPDSTPGPGEPPATVAVTDDLEVRAAVTAPAVVPPVVDADAANDADTARLALHTAVLRVQPVVTKPGSVVHTVGENFPPGERITLAWSHGIPNAETVTVDATGTLRESIVIFHRDLPGPRTLDATHAGNLMGPVRRDLLVVERSDLLPDDR